VLSDNPFFERAGCKNGHFKRAERFFDIPKTGISRGLIPKKAFSQGHI
jgi:hypothetical protein